MTKQAATARKGFVKQTFSLTAPGALSVTLVGDFTHWQKSPIRLRKETGGIWRATVPLEPGEHHYRFLVDGERHDDAECAVRVPNPFHGQNAAVKGLRKLRRARESL